MPATAWGPCCSAWFLAFSHWLTASFFFGHRSCSLSGWQCLAVLSCSARCIGSVRLSRASAFLWPAMSPALRYRGPNEALQLGRCVCDMDRHGAAIRAGGVRRMNVGLVIAGSLCLVLAGGHTFVGRLVLDRLPRDLHPTRFSDGALTRSLRLPHARSVLTSWYLGARELDALDGATVAERGMSAFPSQVVLADDVV